MSNHIYPNDDDGEEEWQPNGVAISDTLMAVIMPTSAYQTDLYKYALYCGGPSI